METREAIARIRDALHQIQAAGQQNVAIPPLLDFLRGIEQEAPVALEAMKLQHESNLAQYKAEREIAVEMLRSVFETSKTALTTSILVNGGATVALLAFLSNLLGRDAPAVSGIKEWLVISLVFFASGVLAGAVSTGTTYLTQYCYSEGWKHSGIAFHVVSILLVVISYVVFLCGIVAAYHGFIK